MKKLKGTTKLIPTGRRTSQNKLVSPVRRGNCCSKEVCFNQDLFNKATCDDLYLEKERHNVRSRKSKDDLKKALIIHYQKYHQISLANSNEKDDN